MTKDQARDKFREIREYPLHANGYSSDGYYAEAIDKVIALEAAFINDNANNPLTMSERFDLAMKLDKDHNVPVDLPVLCREAGIPLRSDRAYK